jgi:hypothetical protein
MESDRALAMQYQEELAQMERDRALAMQLHQEEEEAAEEEFA